MAKKKVEDFLDPDVLVSVTNAAVANNRSVQEEVNHRLRHILGGAERLPTPLRHVG